MYAYSSPISTVGYVARTMGEDLIFVYCHFQSPNGSHSSRSSTVWCNTIMHDME